MGLRALLLLFAGCRYGFALAPDAHAPDEAAADTSTPADATTTVQKPDASAIDAAPPIDGTPGFGGYTITDTTAPYALLAGAPVAGFVAGADDENYPFALPFTFTFYGVPYTALTISMNGYVAFDAPASGADTSLNDCPMDTTAPGAMIALFWDDLYANPSAPSTGALAYQLSGAAPDRRLTVEWRDMDAFYPAGPNAFSQGVRVTQALVLHETGTIEMHYGPRLPPKSPNKDCGADRHRGCSATVGLEAPGSALFANVQCGTSAGPGPGYTPIDEGRLLLFVPN